MAHTALTAGLVGLGGAATSGGIGGLAGPDNPVGYSGYVFNAETRIYTVRFRHYWAALGTWVSRDPAGYADGGNLYEYCCGEPMGYTDPLGLKKGQKSTWLGRRLRDIGWDESADGADALGTIGEESEEAVNDVEAQKRASAVRIRQICEALARGEISQSEADRLLGNEGSIVREAEAVALEHIEGELVIADAAYECIVQIGGCFAAGPIGKVVGKILKPIMRLLRPVGNAVAYVFSKLANRIAAKLGPRAVEVFYRGMSRECFEQLAATGMVRGTGETFISKSLAYSTKYGDVLVRFVVRGGTERALARIGVRNAANGMGRYASLPLVKSGWGAAQAYFKKEAEGIINIGLGRGRALRIFNRRIIRWEVVPK